MTEFMAEVIGTMILMILGSGVVAGVTLKRNKSEGAGWIVVTVAWGLAVAMAVYAVGSVSGAHINPAVTVGLASAGEFPWEKVPMYVIAQMIGAFLGAFIAYLNYLPHWRKTEDPAVKLGVFSTAPAIRHPLSNLLTEIIATFILLLGIMFIGANEYTEGWNPLLIGLLIVSIGMSLGGPTGFAINPARDLAPRLAHAFLPIPGKGGSDWGYAWIPVVGPIIGGVYGTLFYQSIFQNSYTTLFWIMSAIVGVIVVIAVMSQMSHNGAKQTGKNGVA
ncbi:MIP/aquaporin family protein [Lentibacillus saliphilus]|uniref:MIP/aquaporin family protein n=1 Tax=Lentibacillus saliphilus TaxID=2737028 RepID=UPI001C305F7A|nr:MIP/aquaporin family protein [Lentibacillus saliphilus]